MTKTKREDAFITDTTASTLDVSNADTVTIYPAKAKGQWRWTRTAHGNHEKISNGGEAYTSLDDCLSAVIRVNRAPYRITYQEN